MEIGPILRALMHNTTRFWLITLEVALSLAIVANCINMIQQYRHSVLRPTGMDVEHILTISTEPFSETFLEEGFVDAVREQDLERLRSLPGVRAATAISRFPLGQSGSATSRRPVGSELDEILTPLTDVDTRALETLGAELVAGRDFVDSDFRSGESPDTGLNVLLTQSLADKFFPDGDALGRTIEAEGEKSFNTIIGIIGHMHNMWPRSSVGEDLMVRPFRPGDDRNMRYLVRVEDGAFNEVFSRLETTVLTVNADRIIKVGSLTEVKERCYRDSIFLINMLGTLIVLIVLVTSLGIVGLTSFSVTQRTRQIGTRRALGATRGMILRYFLVENLMITGIGLLLGAVLTVVLNVALTEVAGAEKMDVSLLVGGALGLLLVGQLAAFVPALRATFIPPELATRTV